MYNSSRTHLICYIILLAAHIALVWWLQYFPTQDGPSHLYNLVILHDLLNGGKEWGGFFTHQLCPVPNLGFHIVSYPLLTIFSPLIVEKLFVSIYIGLMGISVPIFLRTFGRQVFPIAYLTFPVIFNFTLLAGFYSYVITIPIFLLCISLAWKSRNSSAVRKFLVLNLSAALIFYSHLIPFIFYLLFLFAMILAEATDPRKFFSKLSQLAITLSPVLVNFFFFLWGGIGNSPVSRISRTNLDYQFKDLYFFSTVYFSPLQIASASLLLVPVAIGAYLTTKYLLFDERDAHIAPENKVLLLFLAMLLLTYFLAPFNLGKGSYFNERLPWVIYIVGLPLLYLRETSAQRKLLAAGARLISVIFLVCNTAVFAQQSDIIRQYLAGLQERFPKGAFTMTYKTKDAGWSRVDVLLHAGSYYGIFCGCVDTGNYEAGLPYFLVEFRRTLPAFPPQKLIDYEPSKIKWPLYPCIRYLFGWDIDPGERSILTNEFQIKRTDGRLTIWKRISTSP